MASTDKLQENFGASSAQNAALNNQIVQNNYQGYLNQGGNPALAKLNSDMTISQAAAAAGGGLLGGYGGGYSTASYAPYSVGGGKTKWDEFVQQMQLENQKLQQAQQIENSRLAQEKLLKEEELQQTKALEEEKLQQEQKIADQNTVEAFTKQLTDMKGPKDPYGYLFSSRGLAPPQGYSPTELPLPEAVKSAYQSQGIDLSDAQKQLTGGSGPSFINGYLGGMQPALQQGPMGFQNTQAFANTAPGSQPQPPSSSTPPASTPPSGNSENPQAPTQMARGGVVPGYAPGKDSVPAELSPGEGILRPEAVRMMGGPPEINRLNKSSIQHFAAGGVVSPLYQQPVTDLGNGLLQRNSQATNTNPSDVWLHTQPNDESEVAAYLNPNASANITGPAVTGGSFTTPFGGATSDQWTPVQQDGGNYYAFSPEIKNAGPIGTKESINPDLPSGYQLSSPGVANPTGQNWISDVENWFGANSAPLLTGGNLSPAGPIGGPPMNLNMLDPYTRSLVDQYGVPQIPSAQALANMPQSGLDAYQNYVETVAGGNYQDLLDQSKMLNSQGFNSGGLSFQ